MSEHNGRVGSLKGYGILDTPNEPAFDAIVREAAALLGMPIALVSLLDENRQWFKAKVGLEVSETPLSISFCTHAIRGQGVFEVEDARDDDRFRENPLVTGDPHIRYYAGAPLTTAGGVRIGTLCVIDREPRPGLSAHHKALLLKLAEKVMQILDDRKRDGMAVRLR